MEIVSKVKKPIMPNEIFIESTKVGKKQDGFINTLGKIAVRDLTEKQAVEYAQLMSSTFLEHWQELINKSIR
jgi:hypothetical protein